MADVLTKALPRERFEHLADVLGVCGPNNTARQRENRSGKQWISAIEPSDSITVVQDDDQQCPSTLTPKLPLGLSFKNFVQLIVCITLLMTWLMYRLGQKLYGYCCPKKPVPLKRSVATQSQTTYTAVAKDRHPRFRTLGEESGRAWRD